MYCTCSTSPLDGTLSAAFQLERTVTCYFLHVVTAAEGAGEGGEEGEGEGEEVEEDGDHVREICSKTCTVCVKCQQLIELHCHVITM